MIETLFTTLAQVQDPNIGGGGLTPLEQVMPHVQNVLWASLLLLVAYLLTIPLRIRYGHGSADGLDLKPHTPVQFVGAMLSYITFSFLIILPSVPLACWLSRSHLPRDWDPYHQAWILFWTINALVRVLEGLFVESCRQLQRTCPLSRLNRGLLHVAIMLGVACLLIKYHLHQPVNVLLTSTAIITGVIGFAMQGVLGNLLAGMSLHASHSFKINDWVEIDGTIGRIILVNWRETRIRTVGGHIHIVPNSKLADCTIQNFTSPTSLRQHTLTVTTNYSAAPEQVLSILLEAARDVSAVEARPAPDAYVKEFKDYGMEYILRFWTNRYKDKTPIEGNVMRMIWYKFQRQGIEIPFPMSGQILGKVLETTGLGQTLSSPQKILDLESLVEDLLNSNFGKKLLADEHGNCILNLDELKALAGDLKRVQFTAGEYIIQQKDLGESFYVLKRGDLHGLIESPDSKQPVEFHLKPGAVFGEMRLMTGLPRSATVKAVTDCDLIEFDRRAFTRLLSLREEIPYMLSQLAAKRAKDNADAFEHFKSIAPEAPVLEHAGILERLKKMLEDWVGKTG